MKWSPPRLMRSYSRRGRTHTMPIVEHSVVRLHSFFGILSSNHFGAKPVPHSRDATHQYVHCCQ
jgi:hypothetical protein